MVLVADRNPLPNLPENYHHCGHSLAVHTKTLGFVIPGTADTFPHDGCTKCPCEGPTVEAARLNIQKPPAPIPYMDGNDTWGGRIAAERTNEEIKKILEGVGPDAPTVTNEKGGKQSHSPYRFDLLPPLATASIAKVLAEGSAKYGDWNWKKISIEDNLNRALQHIFAYLAGDTQEKSHLTHAGCRINFALELDEERKRNVQG